MYIITSNNVWVLGFNALLDFLSIFTIIIYLFFIAWGPDGINRPLWVMICWLELLYGIEIILHFFMSISDPETFQTIIALKKIAFLYIFNGSFLPEIIAVIPYQLIFPIGYSDDHNR
jgi:hypothetical protein